MKNFGFTKGEMRTLKGLNTPAKVQRFVENLPYHHGKDCYKSPRWVLKNRKANCFEGAIFAAAALRMHGHEPLIIDLRAKRDEDHILAVFKVKGHWGAIGKSKLISLTYREPIHKNLRELVLTYFEFYFNEAYQKTLREYSVPLNLKRYDKKDWMTTDGSLEYIADDVDNIKHFDLLTRGMEKTLKTVNSIVFKRAIVNRKKD